MTLTATSIICTGCGYVAPPLHSRPFRCPNAGGHDVDHILRRTIDIGHPSLAGAREMFSDPEPDPFIRYRRLTHAWQTAMAVGMTDEAFVALVTGIESRIAAISGGDSRGFHVTPFRRSIPLATAVAFCGPLWVKDETANVAESHKGRHLMGLMIWLSIAGRLDPELATAPLAIASCGNAALAAAVVARAADRSLHVFIPVDAQESVVQRLVALGARLTRCPRQPGVAGDPSYHRFREAVAAGALPFTCQGNENGLVIEGGETLGWEIASELAATGTSLDRLFIQVGGGALASACIAGLGEALDFGVIERLPRIHTVQTASAFPLRRAWERVVAGISGEMPAAGYARAAAATSGITRGQIDEAMRYAVTHRSEFMWPWETTPSSVAGGILDDETYDWAAVVRGMLESGGFPIVVSEERLIEANRLGVESTAIPVGATGASGLAGLIELQRGGGIASGETAAVLFTGRSRKTTGASPVSAA